MSRSLLFMISFTLAVLTVMTHIAQILHLTFAFYAVTCAILFVFALIGAAVWSSRQEHEPRDLVVGIALLIVGLGCAYIAVVQFKPSDDDYQYLPNAIYYQQHPDQPLNFEMHALYSPWAPFETFTAGTSMPYEYLQAALSYMLGRTLLDFYYVVFPALIGFLYPLALYELIRQFTPHPRDAVKGVLIAIIILLMLGETPRAPMNFSFGRLFQGKVVCITLGIMLFIAETLRFFRGRRGSSYGWIFLVSIIIFMVGMSSSAIVYLPLLWVTLTIGHFVITPDRNHLPRRILLYGAAMPYVLLCTLFLLVHSDQSPGYFSKVNTEFPPDYSGQFGLLLNASYPLTPVAAVVSFTVSVLLLPRKHRRFLLVWVAAIITLALNPVVSPIIIRYVTTQNIYWRLFYVVPVPFLVGVAAAQVLVRVREKAPKATQVSFMLLAAGALSLHILLPFSIFRKPGNWPWRANVDYGRSARFWQLPQNEVQNGQDIIDVTPPGVMFAPPHINMIIPLLNSNYPQVSTRNLTIYFFVEDQMHEIEDGENRLLGSDYLKQPDTVNFPAFEATLTRYRPYLTSVVCAVSTCTQDSTQIALRDNGFVYRTTVGDYQVYVAQSVAPVANR